MALNNIELINRTGRWKVDLREIKAVKRELTRTGDDRVAEWCPAEEKRRGNNPWLVEETGADGVELKFRLPRTG